ncbi:TniQ family protein [Pseudotabrizicola sp. L79]|uniref:TniQ family protein n=1 Tax=Pseudotabrizicola sp. L79 TaxID=3118402 RepID=UPI002F94DCA8
MGFREVGTSRYRLGAVMALWPPFPLDPEETLLSYADRLSMFHTGDGMDRLLRDFGINRQHFVSGHEESVDGFAEAVGLPSQALQRASVRVSQRGARFRGEAISKSFLSQQANRYCPACLNEDGGLENYRFRLIWGFRHVSRCDRHDIWLMDAANAGQTNLRLGLADRVLRMGLDAEAEGVAYLPWLRDRLDGRKITEKTWMDGQTIEQVLDASEMLGAILQHGHKVAITKLTAPETEEATDIGFAIYSDGPEAIEEALDTIRGSSSATAVQAGSLAQYGQLFDWLDRRCNALDPGPIRDILRDHIIKHSAVEPGTRVLDVEVNERRYHSLYSLSATLGIERPRLSRILRKMEVISGNATEKDVGNMVFEVARTVPLVEAFATAIPLRDVPDYLGATKRQKKTLSGGPCPAFDPEKCARVRPPGPLWPFPSRRDPRGTRQASGHPGMLRQPPSSAFVCQPTWCRAVRSAFCGSSQRKHFRLPKSGAIGHWRDLRRCRLSDFRENGGLTNATRNSQWPASACLFLAAFLKVDKVYRFSWDLYAGLTWVNCNVLIYMRYHGFIAATSARSTASKLCAGALSQHPFATFRPLGQTTESRPTA